MNERFEKIYAKRIENFIQRLAKRILADFIPMHATFAHFDEPVRFADRLSGSYRPIMEGDVWGQAWSNGWFHLQGTVPTSWKGRSVAAQLDFTGEALVFLPDGMPIQGMSQGSVFEKEYSRDTLHLFDSCQGGEKIDLWVEAAGNDLFGVHLALDPDPSDPVKYGRFESKANRMRLCVFETELWHLWLDSVTLNGLIKTLPAHGVRRSRIIRCLNDAIDVFADDPAHAQASRTVLQRELSKPAAPSDLNVLAVGHAHIDTAWLWPIRETIRKCGRTFSNQVSLLDRYPDYVFGASQPQHYQFTKEVYPALYERIKELVRQGRWEVQGGMWVEADCNIISGESMVRQILHGKNFFNDEFGIKVDMLWLPDVFGYSAAMPQILRKSGMNYFLTQKLSWSQINEFPHHTFNWRGIDGTEVLTHFPPENTYNSMLNTEYMVPGRDRFKEKDFIDEFISLYGIGDGGGGPKEENIEWGKRMEDMEGAPRLRFGRAVDFFSRLSAYKDKVATWEGELYLELHRGTLTTQARVKRMNRKLELALRQVEILWSAVALEHYPIATLDAIWKKVLVHQFHDILPGSSIHLTYEDTHREHDDAMAACETLLADAAKRLYAENTHAMVVVNALSTPFEGVVGLPAGWAAASVDKKPLSCQQEAKAAVAAVSIPAMSSITLFRADKAAAGQQSGADLVLENEWIRYEFNERAELCAAFDKELNRDVLVNGGKGNELALYEDRPNDWDAWDIDLHYETSKLQTATATSVSRCADGPVRQGLCFNLKIGQSTIEQHIYLASHHKRLDFQTRVLWQEKHRMLRVSFPANVRTDHASFDIQYGYCRRPTHRNTSWDQARFEVAAHKYIDLSDRDYGVALLNDCKYGHKVHENVLDLNLLRSTNYPDYDADQGEHEFVYSLLPHKGSLIESDVMSEAAALNQGVITFPGYEAGSFQFPCRLDSRGISLEVLKRAEKESCWVVRLVERHGRSSKATLSFSQPVECIETDLMEWQDGKAVSVQETMAVELKAFEIKTFKLKTV